MASFYDRKILPRLIHHVCGLSPMTKQREKIIPQAQGVVLELGIGSGHNFRHYDTERVKHIIGVDPTPDKSNLTKAHQQVDLSFELIESSAEDLDLASGFVDTVVCTYVLCTITEAKQALEECRRVLKPNGQLLFIEHGLAPDEKVQKTQHRVNGVWKKIAGGCHLNRDIPQIITSAGYKLESPSTMYLPGWKPACWNVWGSATPR